jgi:hypothetical protein
MQRFVLNCGGILTLFIISILFGVLGQTSNAAEQPEFIATQIHEANTPVFGLAWGDFDPNNAGMEVACLLQYGAVLELAPNVPNWASVLVHNGNTGSFDMLRRPTISIGNVHSGYPGNEVVTCAGIAGSMVTVVFYDAAAGWSHEVLFDSTGWMGGAWGARAGDYDPYHPSDEILLIFEGITDASVGILFSEVAGTWEEEVIYGNGEWAEVGMDSATGDFNPDHPGSEIVVATEFGPIYEILAPNSPPESNNWPRRNIWDDTTNAVAWVVKIADIDPCSVGNELIYGTRFSNHIMISHHNGENPHDFEILFTGNATEESHTQMLDIAIGDILPAEPGLEILGVDYTGSVYLVRKVDGDWQGQVIWQDPNSLYAVIAGDFLPARNGDEILVAGESGAITLLTLTFTDSLAGDGRANLQDFAELASYWQQNESSADIGPWPIGDGIIDILDLAVLAKSWLEAAYWVE